MSSDIVRVGIAVVVPRADGKILVGKRKGSHGAGTWALPGGHLDFGESFEPCASREVMEETKLDIKNPVLVTTLNCVMTKDNKHYVTVVMECDPISLDAIPILTEPDKCEEWKFVNWEELSQLGELFLPLKMLLDIE